MSQTTVERAANALAALRRELDELQTWHRECAKTARALDRFGVCAMHLKSADAIAALRRERDEAQQQAEDHYNMYLDETGRTEKLEAALRQIEYLDRPQVRGLPRRKTIQQIALEALAQPAPASPSPEKEELQ